MWANIQGIWEISVLLVNFAVDLKLLYKIKLTLKKKKKLHALSTCHRQLACLNRHDTLAGFQAWSLLLASRHSRMR